MRRNEELEAQCLGIEAKVKLVLANHKMVHETLTKHYGYKRIELMPGMKGSSFLRNMYGRMVSILYEEPQYLSIMLKKAEADEAALRKVDNDETNRIVAIICDRIYANHYKARDETYSLSLIMHAITEDMSNVTVPTSILSSVNYVTKLLSAYVRRGPNTEALKAILFKPLSTVLSRKSLDLEIDPSRVYCAAYEELRFKVDADLPQQCTATEAWEFREVRDIVQPRIQQLLELVELFLTAIISARNTLPYGIRALAKKIYEMAQVIITFLRMLWILPSTCSLPTFLCRIASRKVTMRKK